MKYAALTLAVAFVIAGAFLLLRGSPRPVSVATPSVAVQTMALTLTNRPRLVAVYGTVTGGPCEATLVLPAPGIVAHILVQPGAEVIAGQPLATIVPDAPSIAERQKAEVAVIAAKAERAHVAALLAARLATTSDLAATDQALQDAKASLMALQATGTGQPRTILAPRAGIVIAVLAGQGTAQPAGASLFRLADPAHLTALVGVPAGNVIARGATAQITLLEDNSVLTGTVLSRAAMLDPQTGLRDVTLGLSSPVLIGSPLRANLVAGRLVGYAAPRDAVLSDETGNYVFQLGPDHLAHRATVRVLGPSGADLILAPTLNPAEPLITTGAYQLNDGTPVRAAGQG
ncbi:MAG: hypothetical protein B7X08_06560 [Acidocella sp. 20-63-7]|nr:MAG: hypothetical protein B7X08_06560 [Acidocella sp. 20-63-7]HQT47094.1 HlyD family efflux transporter periplasmic adaptor subunit [Acidocella sp.]